MLHLDLEEDCERELKDLAGATFLVSWASLLLLLSKCRHDCCAALVNPSNMKITVKGKVLTIIKPLHIINTRSCLKSFDDL